MEVAGPFPGGHYFGVVAPDTTVSASGDEVVLLQHPHGRELKEFKASGKNRYVFLRAEGKRGNLKTIKDCFRSNQFEEHDQSENQWDGADSGSRNKKR